MAYYIIKNYSKSGKIGIADRVFERIIYNLLDETENVQVYKSKNLFKQKSVTMIRKGNDLKINVLVTISKGIDVVEQRKILQETISTTIFNLTELSPSKVSVKVESVI